MFRKFYYFIVFIINLLLFYNSVIFCGEIDRIKNQYDKFHDIYYYKFISLLDTSKELSNFKDFEKIYIIPSLIVYDTTKFLGIDSANFYQSIGIDTIYNQFEVGLFINNNFYIIFIQSNYSCRAIVGGDSLFPYNIKEFVTKDKFRYLLRNDLMLTVPFFYSYINSNSIKIIPLTYHESNLKEDELFNIWRGYKRKK
jgi:hypothetical protein